MHRIRIHHNILPALLALFLWKTEVLGAATNAISLPTTAVTNRLTVAILGFENRTGNSSNSFWRYTAERLLDGQLSKVKALRVLPSAGYALRQLKKRDGDALNAIEAGKAGRFIEARRVVWGSCQKINENWVVTARVLNPATDKVSGDLKVASSDWFEIRDQLTEKVLHELAVQPTSLERKKMSRRFTTSPVAFAAMARARGLQIENAPLSELEKCGREAVSADPSCAEAQALISSILFNQGKLEEAEKAARDASQLRPDYAGAQLLLGIALQLQGDHQNSEKALLEAARLDPDDFRTWERLGEVRAAQKDAARAIVYFEKALQLNPFSANVHARIGAVYAAQGQRDHAMAELKKAEQLASGDNISEEQSLGRGFEELREVPSAVNHYQKMISQGRKEGANPAFIDSYEAREKALRDRLTPVYVTAAQPRAYTEESLEEALRHKLSRAEFVQVTNPVACTPEMQRWARQLTVGATNDLEKARMLFDALTRHVSDGPMGRRRTAKETFADWDNPGTPFYCQEHAFLYVALSRAVGLKSYDVVVEEECDGRTGPHACAAVFVQDKVLLVDPMYFWFGVPHKKFQLQDDVQAVAIYLASQKHRLESAQIAAKLYPDLALAQLNLADNLNSAGRWLEALKALSTLQQLDEHAWWSDMARATIAFHNENIQAGIEYLQEVIKKNPDCGEAYIGLGSAYWKQGKLADARSSYRSALEYIFDEENADQTRYNIAKLNELLGQSNLAGQADPPHTMDYIMSGEVRVEKGELAEAVSDYNKAIQLNPNSVNAYIHRAYAFSQLSQLDRALDDCNKAIQLDPNQAHPYEYRGNIYHSRDDHARALADYREASRLNSQVPAVYLRIAVILSDNPELRAESAKEAIKAVTKACELLEWTNSLSVATLASAYGEAGDLDHAIEYMAKALSLRDFAEADGKKMREWLVYWQGVRSGNNVKGTSEVASSADAEPRSASTTPDADPDIPKLKGSAESGDPAAQARLASYLYEGKYGLTTNRVEAYKWAKAAAFAGNKEGSYLIREFDLFMSTEDVSAGKAAAKAYLERAKE